MIDTFGRTIDYLRISVTDRCNERCLYCMPEGYKGWAQKVEHLQADEILKIVEAAAQMGFRKFRVTGGEPLVRQDIVPILEGIRALPGVQTLGLSTNGTRLAQLAPALKQAGVRSLNISLDALDPVVYHAITGGQLINVVRGIEIAAEQGFEIIKLNCVLIRGVNEFEFLPLIHFAAKRGMPLRFIELMPVSRATSIGQDHFLSIQELQRRLSLHGILLPLDDFHLGNGPAKYFEYREPSLGIPAKIGFIGAITTPHFCASCNKLRLTADGKIRPCLGRFGEINLLEALRAGLNPGDAIREAISNKPENHEFLQQNGDETDEAGLGRPMTAIGG